MDLISVVFPAPFGQTSPTHSALPISNDTSDNTCLPDIVLLTPLIFISMLHPPNYSPIQIGIFPALTDDYTHANMEHNCCSNYQYLGPTIVI